MQPDTSSPLFPPNKTKVQQIIGCLLYYARAIDNTILLALNTNAQLQSNLTQHTAKLCHQSLAYCVRYPNVGLRYHKTSYLVAPYAKNRIGGYFFLSSNNTTTTHNAPIYIEYKTLCHVVTSSAECETAVVFHNA